MKERPILFSAPMVRALLAGTKTQTRREVKVPGVKSNLWGGPLNYRGVAIVRADVDYLSVPGVGSVFCPYGQPGDRLWVREAWDFIPEGDSGTPSCAGIRYWADAGYELRTPPSNYNPMLYGKERVRPSIHMPRWASRITLEVTGVRVERLQDISEADAQAEGVTPKWEPGCSGRLMEAFGGFSFRPAASAYAELWEQINGPGSWDANPWVWVVEFKRVG
ncbi:MAG: hypothetical protein RI988_3324 [Pseudomonadota bacterium]|jgi:hypothetical protein